MIQAGAIRGLGLLQLASWIVLFAFYCVGLPGAYICAFYLQWGLVGLWWGVVSGSIAEIVLYTLIIRYLTDWKGIAQTVSREMHKKSTESSQDRKTIE